MCVKSRRKHGINGVFFKTSSLLVKLKKRDEEKCSELKRALFIAESPALLEADFHFEPIFVSFLLYLRNLITSIRIYLLVFIFSFDSLKWKGFPDCKLQVEKLMFPAAAIYSESRKCCQPDSVQIYQLLFDKYWLQFKIVRNILE